MNLESYEENTKVKELVWSMITLFAMKFHTLQSMLDPKANLQKMISCDNFNASQ
jgi:hypothetical protein